MKTRLNIADDTQESKLREVLVRDTKNLKVRTNVCGGVVDMWIKLIK